MKHKMRKTLLAFMLSPLALLFMGNSYNALPPRPYKHEYVDFTYELVKKIYIEGAVTTPTYTYLEFEIHNTGDYYCHDFYIQYADEKIHLKKINSDSNNAFVDDSSSDKILLLGPGFTKRFKCEVPDTRPENINNDIKVYGTAFDVLTESYSLGEVGLVFVDEYVGPPKYYYNLNLTYSVKESDDYHYGLITLAYHEEEYYFTIGYLRYSAENYTYSYEVCANEEINLEEVSYINFMMVEGGHYRDTPPADNTLAKTIDRVISVVLPIVGLTLAGLIAIIVVAVYSSKKKKLTMSDINK